MRVWREIREAFRVELGPKGRPRGTARTGGRRRCGGTAPRCPACELFVKALCAATYAPCGVCTRCCPGGHQPPKPPEGQR